MDWNHPRVSLILVSALLMAGCTNGANSSSNGSSSIGSIIGLIPQDANVIAAEKQIADIKIKINSEPLYALQAEDLSFLKEQGLLSDDSNDGSQLKGWVK